MGMHHGHWHSMGEEEKYQRDISDRELSIRLVKYTFRVRSRVFLLLLIVFSNTLLNLIPPYLYTLAIDRYITLLDFTGLTMLAVAFFLVIITSFVAQFGQRYLISWLGSRLELDLRMDMFRYLQRLSLGYFAKREVGGIVSRVTNDVDKITELVSSGIVTAISDVITLIGIISIMLWMSVSLSLITFSVIPMIIVFMLFWGRRIRSVYRQTRKTIANVSAKIEESVSGMKEIQSFSREGRTRDEFQTANISNMQANVEAGRVMSAFWPAVSIFSAIGNFLVLWFGGIAVIKGTLTIGILFGFMSYLNRFFWPIQDLSMFWNQVQSALAAAERIFNLLDTEIEIEERDDASELSIVEGKISYSDVTFSYEPGQPVLQNISLEIKPNETIALVGPTGAGKTTLINLLYRFYDPQEGTIKIDGRDLKELKLQNLRSHMAIVLQDTFLFTGTIKENIQYGNLKATDKMIKSVAKAVGADEFIEKLPEGYDTEVRERGSRLSMGQRQLISLARALIANPRILIMDEATSSIDAYTELIIRKALETLLRERTSIIIAHRLSTVRNADLIIVLDEGKIVEIGTHDELLESRGLYRQLYEMQFRYETSEELAEPRIIGAD